MICPRCDSPDVRSLQTRTVANVATKRRRRCSACGYRFTTLEIVPDATFRTMLRMMFAPGKPQQTSRTAATFRQQYAALHDYFWYQRGRQKTWNIPPEMKTRWRKLRNAGVSPEETAATLGISRATK